MLSNYLHFLIKKNKKQNLASPLRGIDRYPTPDAHRARLRACGFDDVCCTSMRDLFDHELDATERYFALFYKLFFPLIFYSSSTCHGSARVAALEPFDEYEEWHHKCMHYIVAVGLRGTALAPTLHTLRDTVYHVAPPANVILSAVDVHAPQWRRLDAAFTASAPTLFVRWITRLLYEVCSHQDATQDGATRQFRLASAASRFLAATVGASTRAVATCGSVTSRRTRGGWCRPRVRRRLRVCTTPPSRSPVRVGVVFCCIFLLPH